MTTFTRLIAITALLIGSTDGARAEGLAVPGASDVASGIARPAQELAAPIPSDYILDKADNICGLDSAKQLTNPAVVDYEKLMDATPEIRKMKKEKIDEDSAKGIQLRTAAGERVRKACEEVMTDKSHCSVWKEIKRRDGKKITDITELVTKKIAST